jgi:hypothetical protein
MRSRAAVLLTGLCLVGALHALRAQDTSLTVTIRFGDLQTDCYPSCNHSTEWLQQLHAEVRDSSGTLLPVAGLEFDWGVDYCAGVGFQFGFARGAGLDHIAVDGNLVKNVADCCPACDFQAYDVGVRVRQTDTWFMSPLVRVPNIVIPTAHALLPNFPNPFAGTTSITFDLREHARVQLDIVDVTGRLVTRLADRVFAAGRHVLPWNAEATPSGTYVCRLRIEGDDRKSLVLSRRLLMVR